MNTNQNGSSTLPDSGSRSQFSTGAVRDASEGKGHFSSLPPNALARAARRFEAGAVKYERSNWLRGIPISRYIDSLERHLQAIKLGCEMEDHQGAVIWNAMCLSETLDLIEDEILPPELDDREYTPEAFARRELERSDPDAPVPFSPTGYEAIEPEEALIMQIEADLMTVWPPRLCGPLDLYEVDTCGDPITARVRSREALPRINRPSWMRFEPSGGSGFDYLIDDVDDLHAYAESLRA